MSLRLPVDFLADAKPEAGERRFQELKHGELLLGKVARISPEGKAVITFPRFRVETRSSHHLAIDSRVFALAQRAKDEAVVSLLPNLEEGEILRGSTVKSDASQPLARFGALELQVRLPSLTDMVVPEGSPVRAQVQLWGETPVLRVIPDNALLESGRVVAARPNGTILVDVGRTLLIVQNPASLEVGDTVQVVNRQVNGKEWLVTTSSDVGKPAELPAVSAPPNSLSLEGLVERFLSGPLFRSMFEAIASGKMRIDDSLRELMPLLQQLAQFGESEKSAWAAVLAHVIENTLVSARGQESAAQIEQALRNSGIFLESRLLEAALSGERDSSISEDLKLALLRANQESSKSSESAPAKNPELLARLSEIALRTGRLLDTITAEQFLNLRLLNSEEIYFQLPLSPDSELDFLEIRISRQGKGKKQDIDPRNVQLTLAVTMSKLGRIKASLSIIDGQISCRFRTSSKKSAGIIADNVEMLRAGLEKLDYRVAYIECAVSDDRSEFCLAQDSPETFQKGFDIRV